MQGKTASGPASEADDATKGSAIKLAAEVASRLLGFATTLLLLRGLGAAGFGVFTELSVYALLLAELGELGLQTLASRALVAGTISLRSLARARALLAAVAGLTALAALPLAPRLLRSPEPSPALSLLIVWFALSGWGEFLGVALRCRRARLGEALVLAVLRGAALASAAVALAGGAGLRGVALALALSPLPALALGCILLRRSRLAAPGPDLGAGVVLRESAPLAVHGALLLLSPRVEFLVMSWLTSAAGFGGLDRERALGLFATGLLVVWFLAMVPSAIAAGAMPALTREALRGGGAVRRRTAATLALLAAPAAVGLALVAPSLFAVLPRGGYAPGEYAAAALPLRVMAAALPAMFLNALLASALVAAGRGAWLPRLTAARVVLAFGFAFALVPGYAAAGAALGLVGAEWALLVLAALACRRASFAVPVAEPLAWAFVACVPMALAVGGVGGRLPLALLVGGLTWVLTLLAALRLAPDLVRRLAGDLRYP